MTVRRPGPIVRRLLRSPALLYDCNVGWLLGHRFLRLTTLAVNPVAATRPCSK